MSLLKYMYSVYCKFVQQNVIAINYIQYVKTAMFFFETSNTLFLTI